MTFSIRNTITSTTSTDYSRSETFSGETEKTQTNLTNLQAKPKLPKIESSVGFTALGCDTEEKLQRAAYMAAASRAGIADAAAQRQFADQMQERNGVNLVADNSIELDDALVKARELNRDVTFVMDSKQVEALREFRQQYAENGGAIRFNKKPTIDLRQVNTADGVTIPPTTSPKNIFHVFLKNDGRPVTAERILGQYAEDTYKGGNLWGDNYHRIGEMSVGQGVKLKIIKIAPAGNNKIVDIELSPRDRAVISENYKIVQQQVNEIEKIAAEIDRNNPVSQFILGALDGIKDNLVGTATMVAHPLETLQTIKEAVAALSQLSADDVAKIGTLLKDKITATFTTKDGINSIPYGAGYVVGTVGTDVVIGKGAGLALEGLKEIKPLATLLEKLSELKVLTKTKVAEMFSDEAASSAAIRLRQRLTTTALYTGIPADALADAAIVATNKISKGVKSFTEFQRQMVQEFGEIIQPKLRNLFDKAVDVVYGSRRDIDLHELLGGHTIEKHVGKTEKWLRNRLEQEPDIEAASSFYNKEIASRAQMQATKIYGKEFDDWAKNSLSNRPISRIIDMGEINGIVVRRGKSGVELSSTKVEIRIVKDNTERGWHIISAFPLPK